MKDFSWPFNLKMIKTSSNVVELLIVSLKAILCKSQTKLEMKNFDPPTQIYMEVGPHEGCSKMPIIEVIT